MTKYYKIQMIRLLIIIIVAMNLVLPSNIGLIKAEAASGNQNPTTKIAPKPAVSVKKSTTPKPKSNSKKTEASKPTLKAIKAATPKPTVKPIKKATPKPTMKAIKTATPMPVVRSIVTPAPSKKPEEKKVTVVPVAPVTRIDKLPVEIATPAPVKPDTLPGISGYNISAKPGDIVYFQVFAYALSELGGFDFIITYDKSKLIASYVRSGMIKDSDYIVGNVDTSEAKNGVILVKSDDKSEIKATNGTLFTVVFRVLPGVSGTVDIVMSNSGGSKPKLFDLKGVEIKNITCTNGSIVIR